MAINNNHLKTPDGWLTATVETICVQDVCVQVNMPDAKEAAFYYGNLPEGERHTGFWTRLWPSALALSEYILSHRHLLHNKQVWEIAAGLGVPALLAARFARHVIGSDNNEVAVHNMQLSANENKFSNFETRVWDFTESNLRPACDVILISDANYEGKLHQPLSDLILDEIKKGRTVILSSPNRISGMGFLETLLPFCIDRQITAGIGVFCFCHK